MVSKPCNFLPEFVLLRTDKYASCRAFNACRIPASPSDYAIKVAENEKEAQHFTVVKKNRFYSVPVCDENGQEFSIDQLRR